MDAPIRLAHPTDLPLLRRLMLEFHEEDGHPLDEREAAPALARLVEDASLGRVFLIVADAAASAGPRAEPEDVGYVALTFGFSLEYLGRDAFLDDLFIRPAFRGRGLGSRVLAALEPLCRELGVRALHLEVGRGNRRAQALYRRQGFRDNDRQLLSKRLPRST